MCLEKVGLEAGADYHARLFLDSPFFVDASKPLNDLDSSQANKLKLTKDKVSRGRGPVGRH